VPATGSAVRLARQLDRATATLRARSASASEVRRAAEFQQLAVRALAAVPPAFRQKTIALLDRPAVRTARGDVRAATLLRSISSTPPRGLPDWRIVRPPPAQELLGHYRRAQRRTDVHWTYLAAIHLVETRMGRIRGVSTAGAVGPMQFLPTTWDLYGGGGDIRDPRDATLAAGRLLVANGAPGDMAGALWHYNPSDAYVGAVMSYARTMQRSPSAYHRYWHWRVLYSHARGTHVLPVGYPERRPVRLPDG
jgi:membrane-bound lytic murein transglycosylase B